MPIIKSAIKRAKQTIVRRENNVATKRALKDATKAFNAAPSAATLAKVQSALDTAVKKNVLEKNTVARRKAQYAKLAKEAGVKTGVKTGTKTAAKPATKSSAKPAAKTTSATTAAKKAAPKSSSANSAAKPVAKTAAKPAAKKAAK